MYYVNGKRFEETSETNQKIISLFLKREQAHDITPWVDYILSCAAEFPEDAPFGWPDILCALPVGYETCCPDCGVELKKLPGDMRMACPECGSLFDEGEIDAANVDYVADHVQSWWMVSDFLADKLAERGELVFATNQGSVWGRMLSDIVDISEDKDIAHICSELEILEGQKHAWPVQ